MKFLHAMIKVYDLEKSLDFWIGQMGFVEFERQELDEHRKSFILLKQETSEFVLELDFMWDRQESYSIDQSFGHFAFEVEDIYKTCQTFLDAGIEVSYPPKDGQKAYVIAPDNIELEIFQKGEALIPKEPWLSMAETKKW